MSTAVDEFNDKQLSIMQDLLKEDNQEKKKVTISPLVIVVGIESYKEYNKANTSRISNAMLNDKRQKAVSCHCVLY